MASRGGGEPATLPLGSQQSLAVSPQCLRAEGGGPPSRRAWWPGAPLHVSGGDPETRVGLRASGLRGWGRGQSSVGCASNPGKGCFKVCLSRGEAWCKAVLLRAAFIVSRGSVEAEPGLGRDRAALVGWWLPSARPL